MMIKNIQNCVCAPILMLDEQSITTRCDLLLSTNLMLSLCFI
jgi:hypothetical protein